MNKDPAEKRDFFSISGNPGKELLGLREPAVSH